MRTFTTAEREQIDEVRILLEGTRYPTAAYALDRVLEFDGQEREAKDSDRIEDEGE